MTYESDSFVEHNQVRLPLLEKLLNLGWHRSQIVCPSPDTSDTEWRVPKNPSSATLREKGAKYDGFPCDIAIFDSPDHVGMPEHVSVIIECKAPHEQFGLAELETYLALEPRARLGILTNGETVVRLYKLSDGSFRVEKNAALPVPNENLILSGSRITKNLMREPSDKELVSAFSALLNLIASSDGRSTRSDARLNQICNLLLVKLESDSSARIKPNDPVAFQVEDIPSETADSINRFFRRYKKRHPVLFSEDEPDYIVFDDETIQGVVAELQCLDLSQAKPTALSLAFQVFRNANLKIGDGQYFTPLRVIEASTRLMDIDESDRVIDPACGTGGFLCQAFLSVRAYADETSAARWASQSLYGVDLDDINIKLTRALMVGIGDGATNAYLGDSLREAKWKHDHRGLRNALSDEGFTVVLTNPPFGKELRLSANDARIGQYSICKHTKSGASSDSYASTELGIVFVERAWRLLEPGGRLGIVLPETYFFSKSYEWFREWVDRRFVLRGVLNIPMEAFQGFCRAKTNFYVFEKIGADSEPRCQIPIWFGRHETWISNAPTIGINKDGEELYLIDEKTGLRTSEIDDEAIRDVEAIRCGDLTETSWLVPTAGVSESFLGVPQYWDDHSMRLLERWIHDFGRDGFYPITLGQLVDEGIIQCRAGHGSPSADMRKGSIPYIKVSDLRNGLVNVNSSNMVAETVARRFWKGETSGLSPWDILTPARASKNIGEPVMLLPGQEKVVLTKEVLVFSPGKKCRFDAFYLMWALSNPNVLAQWKRIVFMQTNREDLGNRWREIQIPVPKENADWVGASEPYRRYYRNVAMFQADLRDGLAQQGFNMER